LLFVHHLVPNFSASGPDSDLDGTLFLGQPLKLDGK
jgi:hypothetical protein